MDWAFWCGDLLDGLRFFLDCCWIFLFLFVFVGFFFVRFFFVGFFFDGWRVEFNG